MHCRASDRLCKELGVCIDLQAPCSCTAAEAAGPACIPNEFRVFIQTQAAAWCCVGGCRALIVVPTAQSAQVSTQMYASALCFRQNTHPFTG